MIRTCHWSEQQHKTLYQAAKRINRQFGNRFELDELVNEGWLKYARYQDIALTNGCIGKMHRFVDKEIRYHRHGELQDYDGIDNTPDTAMSNDIWLKAQTIVPPIKWECIKSYYEGESMIDIGKRLGGMHRNTVLWHIESGIRLLKKVLDK